MPATGNRHRTTIERKSEREVEVRRCFNAPARLVFEAWTKPELFRLWWTPRSMGMTMLSCTMDLRTVGRYSIQFSHPDSPQPMTFLSTYLEVIPNKRLVWTNEENGGGAVTTVTLDEKDGVTWLVLHEQHQSPDTIDEGAEGLPEQFDQLEELLATRHGTAPFSGHQRN